MRASDPAVPCSFPAPSRRLTKSPQNVPNPFAESKRAGRDGLSSMLTIYNPKEDGVQAFAALGDEHQEFPIPKPSPPGAENIITIGSPRARPLEIGRATCLRNKHQGPWRLRRGSSGWRPDWYLGGGPRCPN